MRRYAMYVRVIFTDFNGNVVFQFGEVRRASLQAIPSAASSLRYSTLKAGETKDDVTLLR